MAEYADQLSFSDTNDEYKAFVDKFKPKKTTDDCYTPENIYDAVCGWVEMEYGVSRDRFVRPFWPGGDYQRFEYPEGCIVVDNPPFSIITQIKNFYTSRGIDFFLFAPSLTLISGYKRGQGVSYIAAKQEREVPDTYSDRMQIVYGADGEIRLPGPEAGLMISLRVFASGESDIRLTQDLADHFSFSGIVRHTHRARLKVSGSLSIAYTGKAYVPPVTLPEGAAVSYKGDNLTDKGLPLEVGSYKLLLTIPEDHPTYLPGTYAFDFQIRKINLLIHPVANLEKFEGEEDPAFPYTVTGLLEEDKGEVKGELTREEGEEAGNYAFDVSGLTAPDCYTLTLASDAPVFTILPAEWDWDEEMDFGWNYALGDNLKAVVQQIVRQDGRRLSVEIAAVDTLKISGSTIGKVVTDTVGSTSQIFTPTLSFDSDQETVLLRLRTEPELNEDQGYATDATGHVIWSGRMLKLNWQNLEHLQRMGVDAVSLVNGGASLTVSVSDLLSSSMQSLAKSRGWGLAQTVFQAVVIPSDRIPESVLNLRPLTDGWTMGIFHLVDGTVSYYENLMTPVATEEF